MVKMLVINPSSQMHNAGVVGGYIEGAAMKDLGFQMEAELDEYGITSSVVWSGFGDRIDGLKQEVRAANKMKPDHFISLHSDSAGQRSKVMVIYFYSAAGKELADAIGRPVAAHFGFRYESRKNTSFYVLKHTRMPAILIETLNHSSYTDCTLLNSSDFRNRLAYELAKAYANYVGYTQPVEEPKEEIVMYHRTAYKHFLSVEPDDKILRLSNTDDDNTVTVERLYFDEHGTKIKEQEVTIDPRATWSQKIDHYGLIVLRAGGKFTARLCR
jgi:hypothetical protein